MAKTFPRVRMTHPGVKDPIYVRTSAVPHMEAQGWQEADEPPAPPRRKKTAAPAPPVTVENNQDAPAQPRRKTKEGEGRDA